MKTEDEGTRTGRRGGHEKGSVAKAGKHETSEGCMQNGGREGSMMRVDEGRSDASGRGVAKRRSIRQEGTSG